MSVPRVEMQIDELLLEGFERVDAAAVERAVRRELERLMGGDSRNGLSDSLKSSRLDAGDITVGAGATAEEIGVQVARAVHRGLMGGGRR